MRWGFVAEPGDNACTWYRCELVRRGLVARGHEGWVANACSSSDSGRLLGVGRSGDGFSTKDAEVIVLRCATEDVSFATEIARARAAGQIVFVDIDDDVWHMTGWNPDLGGHVDVAGLEAQMDAADGVLCSTPVLAGVVAAHTSSPVHVCVAGVDPSMFAVHLEHRPLRVGWLGTLRHRGDDLASVYKPLAAVVESHDVEFCWLGATCPADVAEFCDRFARLGPPRVVPWVPVHRLHVAVEEIDIAVIPSRPVTFNQSRSAQTGLAAAAAGLAILHSGLPSYVEADIGRACRSAVEWSASLAELIESDALRWSQGSRNRRAVRDRFAPRQVAAAWLVAEHSARMGRASVPGR